MARETVLAVRLSENERNKIQQIIDKVGLHSLGECVRYSIDRVFMNEVVADVWNHMKK
jgi:hypothetical protein